MNISKKEQIGAYIENIVYPCHDADRGAYGIGRPFHVSRFVQVGGPAVFVNLQAAFGAYQVVHVLYAFYCKIKIFPAFHAISCHSMSPS